MAAFGDLLSELRRDMKMTQDELAKVLFVSPEVLEKRTASGKTWSQTIADVQTLTPDRQRALLRILDDMRTASIIETLKKEKE